LFHVYMPHTPRAAGIQQSVRLSYYMARAGADVRLHLCTSYFKTREELLHYFGLGETGRWDVRLHLQPLRGERAGRLWGMVFHTGRLARLLLTREKRDHDVFFSRGHRFPGLHVLFRRWLGHRIVFEMHEILYLREVDERELFHAGRWLDFERYAYRHADGVVITTHSLKHVAERKWGARDRVTVIPSGAVPFPSAPLPPERELRQLYFVGNYYALNGLDFVVRALPRLPELTLNVVGGGGLNDPDRERIERLVAELGLESRVRLHGHVEPARLGEYYAAADLLVLPLTAQVRTKHFASPSKLFEYLSARRPIVASDLPTVREVLRDGDNAILVPPEDPEALAVALRRVIEDRSLASRLAERAYAESREYAFDRRAERILAFLRELPR
jgi:glycosyltransferase involved in cell wall biosynthesis